MTQNQQWYDQDAWTKLVLANANMNTLKAFNEEYIIYYRSTRYTPPYEFKKCSLNWCFLRGRGNNPPHSSDKPGDANPVIECCININEPGYDNVNWRIYNDRFGRHCIVVEKKT